MSKYVHGCVGVCSIVSVSRLCPPLGLTSTAVVRMLVSFHDEGAPMAAYPIDKPIPLFFSNDERECFSVEIDHLQAASLVYKVGEANPVEERFVT